MSKPPGGGCDDPRGVAALSDNDHLSCVGEPAKLGDGPALYMRPEDPGGTIRFWPSGELAAVADQAADLWLGVCVLDTPYEIYIRPDDPPGTFRIRIPVA